MQHLAYFMRRRALETPYVAHIYDIFPADLASHKKIVRVTNAALSLPTVAPTRKTLHDHASDLLSARAHPRLCNQRISCSSAKAHPRPRKPSMMTKPSFRIAAHRFGVSISANRSGHLSKGSRYSSSNEVDVDAVGVDDPASHMSSLGYRPRCLEFLRHSLVKRNLVLF